MELIHYSRDENFKIRPIVIYRSYKKPIGALWCSPVSSTYGWKEWCDLADFEIGDHEVVINISTHGLLVIDCKKDLDKLPFRDDAREIKFDLLVKSGVEAIHLTERGEYETRLLAGRNLYGWDCDSVAILNEACIVSIDGVFVHRPPVTKVG